MMIDDRDNSASFDLTIEVGEYFGLREDEMRVIASEVVQAVSTWQSEAKLLGISTEEISRMATAFEHDEMKAAIKYANASQTL